MTLLILYLLGALGVSFLCSILEAVLLSTPMSFISMKESQGDKLAPLLYEYKNDIDRPVAAILALNTIAHTIGAAGVGSESTRIFGEEMFGVISAILTLLILVFSEIIPKTIGASYWRKLAIPCTRIIQVLVVICYPLVKMSEVITKVFSTKGKQATVSREEVSAMVHVGTEEGIFKAQENTTIQNFLTTANVTANKIMTPSIVVASAPATTTMREFQKNKQFNAYSRILVYDDNKDYITGYILRASVLEKLAEDKFVYDGKEKTPDVVVKNGDTVLTKNTDYTISYKNNLNAGKAMVTVTGTGKYTGEVTKEFEIAKAAQELKVSPTEINISVGESAQIEVSGQGQISYKSDAEEKVTVSNTGKVTGKQAGKATITITAAGNENYNKKI